MKFPVQTAVWLLRGEGAFAVEVGVQLSVEGSYRPPDESPDPPQTTIRLPVQTAVWLLRVEGTFVPEVGVHVSVPGSYRPPVLRYAPP